MAPLALTSGNLVGVLLAQVSFDFDFDAVAVLLDDAGHIILAAVSDGDFRALPLNFGGEFEFDFPVSTV